MNILLTITSKATLLFLLLIGQAYASSSLTNVVDKTTHLSLGVGVAFTNIDDYIGSDESQTYVIPVPYVYYQSENVTVDRNTFEGDLFESGSWHLALNAGGSIPVDSDENKARQGMADLDWVGELGPSIEYYFTGNSRADDSIYIDFSLRKAMATNFSRIKDIGWTGQLSLHKKQQLKMNMLGGETNFEVSVSALFYTDKYAQYFYSVSKPDVTPERFAYQAYGGYAGLKLAVGGTWRKNNVWLGLFTRYTDLNNSTFENSPLVKSNSNLLVGLAISYIFMEK